ncbi:PREDICTED: bax inhibitor 1 [Camelina sativa]|uniref:Bax inhibitor 1 n=1 Tax=Camelina sativa TaxID=90675 RepID=A0ABM0V1X7_CAMSA|nr:PREDICTED: bax inhibitor 1 [Camelina sativa]
MDSQSQNSRIWSYESLTNFHDFSPAVQSHLKRVYLTLCCALLVSAYGAYLHMLYNIGGQVTTLGFTGTMFWLRFTPSYAPLSKRRSVLFLYSLLKGASVGTVIKVVINFDSSVLITAFVGTAVVFACFSAAAMLARRREYLYLGASISCCMSIFWLVKIASKIFGGSAFVFMFEQYLGLFLFVGYIVVDTQIIIEKAHRGDMDYVQHSFTFFTDLASLFVRVIVLNMFKKMKKRRKN